MKKNILRQALRYALVGVLLLSLMILPASAKYIWGTTYLPNAKKGSLANQNGLTAPADPDKYAPDIDIIFDVELFPVNKIMVEGGKRVTVTLPAGTYEFEIRGGDGGKGGDRVTNISSITDPVDLPIFGGKGGSGDKFSGSFTLGTTESLILTAGTAGEDGEDGTGSNSSVPLLGAGGWPNGIGDPNVKKGTANPNAAGGGGGGSSSIVLASNPTQKIIAGGGGGGAGGSGSNDGVDGQNGPGQFDSCTIIPGEIGGGCAGDTSANIVNGTAGGLLNIRNRAGYSINYFGGPLVGISRTTSANTYLEGNGMGGGSGEPGYIIILLRPTANIPLP